MGEHTFGLSHRESNPFSEVRTHDSYIKLFELFLFTFAMSVAVSVGASLFLNKVLFLGIQFEEIYIPVQGLAALAACLGALRENGVDFRKAWEDWRRNALRDLGSALMYYGVYLLIIAALLALAHFLGLFTKTPDWTNIGVLDPQKARDNALLAVLSASKPRFLLMLFGICVVTPLGEELLYRRMLYVSLRKRMGFLKSLFASSVIFSAAHTSASLAVFPISLLLGYVYEKKRRLPANIILHGLINLFATAVHLLL